MMLIEHLSRLLGIPAAYRTFRQLVCPKGLFRTYVNEYITPVAGEKVLDIGCGPGDILDHLPNVLYTGLDVSSAYIESARKRFGSRGRFLCGDIGKVSIEREAGTFDAVLATGVLHHLADAEAISLMEIARLALRSGGRLITYDGCYIPCQSRMARWLLRSDRGKFVRTVPEYERLASTRFQQVHSQIRQDLLRIPYTHLIMRCTN